MSERDPSREREEQERIQRLREAMYSRKLEPLIKEKPRRELELTPPPVGEEFIREEPLLQRSAVAPRSIRFTRVLIRWFIVGATAFFVGAAGFFAYYFFLGGGSTLVSPGNIDISVSGPLQVASGSPTELQVAVVNRNRAALELADLVITYPSGTRSPVDLSTDLPSQRISLGNIEPGGRRQGTVSAVFSGVEGERGVIKIELEYRLANSSSIFVAKSNYQIVFASSPLSLSVVGNNETVSGQPIEFKVSIASNADSAVKDVILNMSVPFGFTLSYSDPQAQKGTNGNLWVLGDIAPGQKKAITIRGVVNGESGDERVFRFTAGTRKDAQTTAVTTTLADYAHHLMVSRPFLGLAVALNKDMVGGSAVVAPGETVNVSVSWENNLSTEVTDAVIVAKLGGIEIDGATVHSSDGFYRSSDKVVLWDKTTTRGVLANLPSGAKGTLNFTFQMPNDDVLSQMRNPALSISVHAAGKRVSEKGVPETLQSTATQNIKLASDLQLIAQGLYYSNPFGSSGPMPPKADTETTYALVFSVTNTTNRITNGVVTATLPPYVRWTGIYSPSSEEITFNQSDSTVTWKVGTIEPGTGVDGALPKQAAIAIGLTPSTSQIGQQPVLIRGVTLKGVDEATGATVTRVADDITTNISGDPGFSAGSANVVR
ncbi:hypothetical protein A2765_02675 [Candidatus Kaiserbacteria bacterium RIFCSPHIGHO2_01_FULL_56_24]|uniref:DUF11 domain-containing protein n=1 Tax=Candidatus Kaiserbacteria bacterium RIFCSPHIGHO2_01_FULL_56_24 TaxID=1798487 RepID=A0A1F6DC65_9BACT|nr:MAG: hypothetical protein A2765_02675 [Candidatus Kaiserbacteria bacterium RIFCSPHIGHO2_01_FULL_56_24]